MKRKACCAVMLGICLMGLVNCSSVRPSISVSPVVAVATMSGTPQSHEVNGAFGAPLVATVTTNGSPTAGMVVTFTAPATGASGTFLDTRTNTTTARTDANGLATPATFGANGTAGTYAVTALASGASAPASFTLTNTIGAPATIQFTAGNHQSAAINAMFASPLMVTVVDGGGNPVSNATVTFTAPPFTLPATVASGTFASNGTNTEMQTTNTNGVATSSEFTADAISGPYAVTVTAGSLPPANFTLTNSAGAAASITATSGSGQTAKISSPFAAPLVATVLDGVMNGVTGVAVTFTAPPGSAAASGTFGNGTNTETDTTNASGVATSSTFTADAVTGSYAVTATVAGVSTSANFNLTNRVAATTYVFYLSGQGPLVQPSPSANYYALAGAVQIDGSGNVIAGEQDYNAGNGNLTSLGDTISGGSLSINSTTGQGTLSLQTSSTTLPNGGTEVLGIQFVNSSHALITQFDGAATSSGSLDLQTLPNPLSVGSTAYAFTLSGVDFNNAPIAFGGVFAITGGNTLQNGVFDTNDAGTVVPGTTFTGTVSTPDSFGRGSLTGFTNPNNAAQPVALNYYIVGPEVIRMIDVDTFASVGTNDSALGSAFGQGASPPTFSNASLKNSVFGIWGVPFVADYAAAGMLSPNSTAGTFTGIADDAELSNSIQASDSAISGSYSVGTNGRGSLTIAPGTLGSVSALGIYMTDPRLNLADPNNPTGGLGGALVADMDVISGSVPTAPVGAGILIPQSDASTASFTGTYAFGAQGIALFSDELDFVGQGSVTGGVLTGTGLVSDPFLTLSGGVATNTGATFAGTATPDASNPGRYTMLSANTDPLNITVGTTTNPFDVVIYQASGGLLLWLSEDESSGSEFLGSLQQATLTGLPAAKKGVGKMKTKRKP